MFFYVLLVKYNQKLMVIGILHSTALRKHKKHKKSLKYNLMFCFKALLANYNVKLTFIGILHSTARRTTEKHKKKHENNVLNFLGFARCN